MKVIVLGRNAQGEPEFHSCNVEAGQEAVNNGDHYDLATKNAGCNGFEGPFVAFDENDQAAKQLGDLATWLGQNQAVTDRNTLAEAIRNAAVKAGICATDANLSGPQLLMLCDDMATTYLGSAASKTGLPLWVVIHNHQYGTTDYACYAAEEPDVEKVIGADYEEDKGDTSDIFGPFMAPSTDTSMCAFITNVANLLKWTGDDQEPSECEEPSEGAWDSHATLMNLIDEARKLGASDSNTSSAPAPDACQRKLMLQMENELHSLRKHADDLALYKLQKGAAHELEMLLRKLKELDRDVKYMREILNG